MKKESDDIVSNLDRLKVLHKLYSNLKKQKYNTARKRNEFSLAVDTIEEELEKVSRYYSYVIESEIEHINREYGRYIALNQRKAAKKEKLPEKKPAPAIQESKPQHEKRKTVSEDKPLIFAKEEKPEDITDTIKIPSSTLLGAETEKKMSQAPKPVKLNFLKRIIYAIRAKEKPWLKKDDDVVLKGMLSKEFLNYIFKGKEAKRKKDTFLGETKISPTILSYEDRERIEESLNVSKADVLNPYLLGKQVTELKTLISKNEPEIYRANTLGYVSNVTVRKLGIYFIEKYPDFFKSVYKSVRHANIRVLANTYINIIFFITLLAGIASFPVLITFFAFQGSNFFFALLNALFFSGLVAATVFWLGSYYPNVKAKARRRSINTNLPFAIDHMASVISSGVSPAIMFKLISNSEEYGEISVEIEKVNNYIEFFGYDILTALKAIALTTPSQDFKEFIDGFVSTIETGGDLKEYLEQKSSESLLNYKLERQKYVESLSTYSDIYTGVLIAAPLFFVTALSLVSAFGGTLGGIPVNTLITLGTYVMIPLLNIVFLVFLEVNQPEV